MSGLFVARRGQGPAVVLLHGFGQDHSCLGALGDALATTHTVIGVDLPRHGRSRALGGPRFEDDAALIAAAVGEPASWIGYSLGGRYALRVAVERPAQVQRLITIGATAGIADPVERAQRVADDELLARALEQDGCARFFEGWLARPLFAGLPPSAQFRAVREAQDAAALAASLRRAGTGSMAPLWASLERLAVPLTCLAGSRDAKFVAVAEAMARASPGGRSEVIEGAGHAAHLERPTETVAAVRRALGP